MGGDYTSRGSPQPPGRRASAANAVNPCSKPRGSVLEVGRPWVFALASATVLVWAITGPLFHFSDTWQLVINTGTTIVTFLMVFLIQNSQNRDSAAIQVKLDELIRASAARNAFVGVEHLTDAEIEEIRARCESRAKAELARRAARRKPLANGATGPL